MPSTSTSDLGPSIKKQPQEIFLSGCFTVCTKCSSRSFLLGEQRTNFVLNSWTKKWLSSEKRTRLQSSSDQFLCFLPSWIVSFSLRRLAVASFLAFSLSFLFLTIFVERWMKTHAPHFYPNPFSILTGFSWVYFAVAQKDQIITFNSFSFPSTPFFSLDFNISCFSFLFENAAHRP